VCVCVCVLTFWYF